MREERSAEERPDVTRKPWQRPVLLVYGTGADLTGARLGPSGPPASDCNLKEHIEPVDTHAMLTKLAALPVATWNYIADDPGVRHMGPMAQDFAATFGLGADDRHIHVIDASGVALASLQALHELVQEQGRQIALLRAELSRMRDGSGLFDLTRSSETTGGGGDGR